MSFIEKLTWPVLKDKRFGIRMNGIELEFDFTIGV